MRRAVRVAQGVAQDDAVALMRFHAEGEQAAGASTAAIAAMQRRQIVEIDKDIGGKDEMIVRLDRRFAGEEARDVGLDQPVVDALAARLRQHRRRQIDADQPVGRTAGRRCRQARCRNRDRAPSRISCARCARLDRAQQQLRRAVAEPPRSAPHRNRRRSRRTACAHNLPASPLPARRRAGSDAIQRHGGRPDRPRAPCEMRRWPPRARPAGRAPRRARTRRRRNPAQAPAPAPADRRRRPDRPRLAPRAPIRSGGRRAGCRRTDGSGTVATYPLAILFRMAPADVRAYLKWTLRKSC